jgi:hypothetical protein
MAEIGLLCPASPTRITPVLVTAGAALVPVATAPMPLAAGEDMAGVGVLLREGVMVAAPMVSALPARLDAADIGAAAEVRTGAGAAVVLRGGWVMGGAVVGLVLPAVTTMFTEGLPAPQEAVTA